MIIGVKTPHSISKLSGHNVAQVDWQLKTVMTTLSNTITVELIAGTTPEGKVEMSGKTVMTTLVKDEALYGFAK